MFFLSLIGWRECLASFFKASIFGTLTSTHSMMYVCMVITHSESQDQPGKVANPARGQLKRENVYFSVPFAPKNLVSRDGFDSTVSRQPAHLHTQAEYDLLTGILPIFAAATIYLFKAPHAIGYPSNALPLTHGDEDRVVILSVLPYTSTVYIHGVNI